MYYVFPDFPSKAELKRAIARGETIDIQPTEPHEQPAPQSGTVKLPVGGPHYPRPHRWYGEVTVQNGRVTAVQ